MLYKIGKHWINPDQIVCIRSSGLDYYVHISGTISDDDFKISPAEFDELQRLAPEHFAAASKTEVAPADLTNAVSMLKLRQSVNVGDVEGFVNIKAFPHQMGNGDVILFEMRGNSMMDMKDCHRMIELLNKAIALAEAYNKQENSHD